MNSKLLTVVISAFALAAFGQQTPSYSDNEAAQHVGEEATVTGIVASVSTSSKGTTFLNFGARFPRHTFGGVIFSRNEADVGDVKQYEGKEVSLTGRIEASPTDKKPQIVIKSADQLKFATKGSSTPPTPPPAPAPAPTTPTATPPMPPTPAPAPARAPNPEPSKPASATRIALGTGWNSPSAGGEMTRKDLARLFGDVATPGTSPQVDDTIEVYPGIPILAPLEKVKKFLNLSGATSSKAKVMTPGLPKESFTSWAFNGVFPGGFNRLVIVTDNTDQVVSMLAIDSSGRTRVQNETDTIGYHTYNFINGGAKAKNDLYVKHVLSKNSHDPGVIVVDTLLVDPTDPDPSLPPSRSSKSSTKPKTGKILERSRWFVPVPLADLILHCVMR
jgi:hypothetical protein